VSAIFQGVRGRGYLSGMGAVQDNNGQNCVCSPGRKLRFAGH